MTPRCYVVLAFLIVANELPDREVLIEDIRDVIRTRECEPQNTVSLRSLGLD